MKNMRLEKIKAEVLNRILENGNQYCDLEMKDGSTISIYRKNCTSPNKLELDTFKVIGMGNGFPVLLRNAKIDELSVFINNYKSL